MKGKVKIVTNGLLKENPSLRLVLGTCPTLALTTLAVNGLGMGLATGKAADATARQPEASGKISASLMMGLALTESCAIYGFVTALIIIFTMA